MSKKRDCGADDPQPQESVIYNDAQEFVVPQSAAPARAGMNDDARRRRRTKIITVVILVLIAAAALAITISQMRGGSLPTWNEMNEAVGITETTASPKRLAVHFIDVGQGDAILIQTPGGQTVLIDAGENGNEQRVIDYIKKYGDDTIEYVVATHPHSDHIGALDGVIGAFTVENVIMPRLGRDITPTTAAYGNLLTAVKKSGAKTIAAKPGYTFPLGKGICTVLSPSEQSDNLNNMSVVLRLDWGKTSFLFMGDAETAVEKQLLNGPYAGYLHVNVLKLGHHGSSTSSSARFLNAVSPRYSVISCGVGNDFGHPHRETIQKLEKMDTKVLRTDEMGSIRIYSDGAKLTTEYDYE